MAKYKSDQKLRYKEPDEIINFGYVKGKTIGEVADKDNGFVVWAKKNCKGFWLSVKIIRQYGLDPDTYAK